MKIAIYTTQTNGQCKGHLHHVYQGFKRHGIEPEIRNYSKQGQECDVAVTWGMRMKHCADGARKHLVVERAYVGERFWWTSMGWDGLNGNADFCNKNVDGRRWDKYFSSYMSPWSEGKGSYVLLLGQVPTDCSLRHMPSYKQWLYDTARTLTKQGHNVLFRAHPSADYLKVPNCKDAPKTTIMEAVLNADFVVTFNSNSALDAVLLGTPAVVCDVGGMAYAVSGHDLLVRPPMPDRQTWAHRLAYCQWTPDEIANGDAWDHLKQGVSDGYVSAPFSSLQSAPVSRREARLSLVSQNDARKRGGQGRNLRVVQ